MNHVLFPITYSCNLSCEFCAVKGRKETVDIDKCLGALKEKKGQAEWVYITGGEPFLVEDLSRVCKEIGKDFKVGVTTNGTIFRPEVASCVNRIGISLDGDRTYHDAYRGPGVFDKAISLFEAVKDKCETVVMSAAFKGNEQALRSLKPIVEKMNPTYWQIQRDANDPTINVSL
jgi:MoaA/NifB/PqqE/SkfB family radical SAM enzyme